MIKLTKEIKDLWRFEIVPTFIKRLEETLDATLKLWGYRNLDHYVEDKSPRQRTVEKTKLISGFYENKFKEVCREFGLEVSYYSGDGFDVIIGLTKYEMKMTSSDGDSWTGNCYSTVKVQDYILIKLDFNEFNKVDKLFFTFFSMEHSSWSGPSSSNNTAFSNLSIKNEDYNNLDVIYGDVRYKNGSSKYLGIIKEEFNSDNF